MRTLFALLLAALALPAVAENPTQQLDAALAQARERHLPVLVDFHAPWCYSCYYMKKNVLNGPEWKQAERAMLVIELDADAPEGAYWREQWQVKALPSYVVLNEQGQELGRIAGEQTRTDFYRDLKAIAGKQTTQSALQESAVHGDVQSAAQALQTFHARRDPTAALAWYASLPEPARKTVAADATVNLWLARLKLQRAAQAKDSVTCLAAGGAVLGGVPGCEYPYELDTVMQCADATAAQRNPLLAAQRSRMDAVVASGAFGKKRCADQRSIVLAAADLYAALDDKAAEKAVLDRAIADTRKRIGGKLRRDRNLADNLRVYLDRTGDTVAFDALLPKLITAYPDDYVYPYRYGKALLARGKAAEALPLLEKAAEKAYGINRFKVAEQRVQALKVLNRQEDANRVIAETLKANGPWFPEESQKLKALMGG